MLYNKYQQ